MNPQECSTVWNKYRRRKIRRIVSYRNYDMHELVDYKREMVLLYYPFKNEHVDILDQKAMRLRGHVFDVS